MGSVLSFYCRDCLCNKILDKKQLKGEFISAHGLKIQSMMEKSWQQECELAVTLHVIQELREMHAGAQLTFKSLEVCLQGFQNLLD